MKKVAMVVEGLGDRKAFPSLVAKTGLLFKKQVFACHVVEGGGWHALKRPGELERNCQLAASDGSPDEVLVVTDLEDECPAAERKSTEDRLLAISGIIRMPVKLVFAVREYETWFLEGFAGIVGNSPEIPWAKTELTEAECRARGAKEAFERALGASYRQSVDQDKFTKRLDLVSLVSCSRSYRKFVKEVVGVSYEAFP